MNNDILSILVDYVENETRNAWNFNRVHDDHKSFTALLLRLYPSYLSCAAPLNELKLCALKPFAGEAKTLGKESKVHNTAHKGISFQAKSSGFTDKAKSPENIDCLLPKSWKFSSFVQQVWDGEGTIDDLFHKVALKGNKDLQHFTVTCHRSNEYPNFKA